MGVKVIGESGLVFPVRDNSVTAIKKGEKRWNLKEGSIETGLFDNVSIVDGSDTFKLIRNNSGSTMLKGRVIMASGTLGSSGRIIGSLSDGTVANAIRNIGITKHNIISGNDGVVIKDGKIDNMDTTGSSVGESWIDGTILYIKPNDTGALTSVVPTAGQLKMPVAFVIKAHASAGSIEVRFTGVNENGDDAKLDLKADITDVNTALNFKANTADLKEIGVGQTWQDVTASRTAGTTYTNSTGKPIKVLITIQYYADSNIRYANFNVGGVITAKYQLQSNITGQFSMPTSIVIPSGAQYSFTTTGSLHILHWSELR